MKKLSNLLEYLRNFNHTDKSTKKATSSNISTEDIKTFDRWFSINLLIFIVFCGCIGLLPFLFTRESENFDFTKTGQIGDTIGGTMSPFVGIAAAGLTFLAFWVQYKANEIQKGQIRKQHSQDKIESFEKNFFELLNLHKQNVAELSYQKTDRTHYKARRVIKEIVSELIECIHEIKRFRKMFPENQIYQQQYREKIQNIRNKINFRIKLDELAIIDIAYTIVFFGLTQESESVLMNKFYNRYNREFIRRLKFYLSLKPNPKNLARFTVWEKFKSLPVNQMIIEFNSAYAALLQKGRILNFEENDGLIFNLTLENYCQGHHFQLGHYFRHLFQSFKFLSSQSFLSKESKYNYAKILRAQLSTYEQLLLMFNSVSSLGMKWEYQASLPKTSENLELEDFKFITRYHLIKNLPGSQFFEYNYRSFFPNVDYEYKEDISYQN